MYVCSCFGVTEQQVKQHAEAGACTPRQIASACKAGTDCGGCVRRIQALLGRGECPRRELLERRADPLAASVGPSADPPAASVQPPAAAFPEAA
ncbi:(2Fe-2S)-binding protein [Streptomyces sp. NBC_01335]|uniref:(2Fe-2S)-binding protein n=1 Tax=Streptomyces sp. NBC_01335 TaxID=2903828 RepID=UPI002E15C0B7|nr:(2Fe-2S)-binding protein [Streptomyces sp. NBC_01335]